MSPGEEQAGPADGPPSPPQKPFCLPTADKSSLCIPLPFPERQRRLPEFIWKRRGKDELMTGRYPRPQCKRESFQGLDGEWMINGAPGLVPSCRKEETLHYEKSFVFHREKARAILHIDAADQIAEVYLNGQFVGRHEGGYLPFSFDISEFVREGENLLTVDVTDHLDPAYPYGKQRKKPSGMWYTPISGIWKSVWIEQVPEEYIRSVRLTPDLKGVSVEITSAKGERRMLRIEPKDPVCWTPEHPKLYTHTIELGEDRVEIYYALRTIEIREIDGVQRVCLNNEPIFLNGVLDQGYWPGSLFIPDSEDGYEKDILRMKELGFHFIRKHIKVEDEEFYYQCDRLGMLVMQDMVQTGEYRFLRDSVLPTLGVRFRDRKEKLTPAQRFFLKHSEETVTQLFSHPCIIAWTIFNEGWGQFNSDALYTRLKQLDPGRLVDSASGWSAQGKTDFDSWHIYFRLVDLKPKRRPLLISECGGYTLALHGEKIGWGYGRCRSSEELTDRIIRLYDKMVVPRIRDGVCGVVYTQLSDIEGERNGLYTFTRECKVDQKRLSAYLTALSKKGISRISS